MTRRSFLQLFPLAFTGWIIEKNVKKEKIVITRPYAIIGCLPMCLGTSCGTNLSR